MKDILINSPKLSEDKCNAYSIWSGLVSDYDRYFLKYKTESIRICVLKSIENGFLGHWFQNMSEVLHDDLLSVFGNTELLPSTLYQVYLYMKFENPDLVKERFQEFLESFFDDPSISFEIVDSEYSLDRRI